MSSPPFFPLTELPEVPLDKVISYLDAEDLRTFHRVSWRWNAALESRKKDNDRRKELVRCIQENKENLANGATIQEAVPAVADHRAAARERTADDKKNGADHYLMECTNLVQQSTPVMSKVTTPDSSVFLTPISPFEFQKFEEAEKSLERGQKLYQCGRCRGPVPSPVVAAEPKESRRPRRCKLISIMNLPDEHHSDIQQQERKKVKTLSTVPPALSSPPATVASIAFLKPVSTITNMIPSPVPVSSEFNSQLSIEHGRNIQDYSHSNGAMSSSSFSFQQSVPNSEGSIVLECPQPFCRFRFCSNCEESEHSGRPCHLLSSDHMESFSEDSALGISSSFSSNRTKRLDAERSKETSLKKTKNKTKSHNKSLRRLARL